MASTEAPPPYTPTTDDYKKEVERLVKKAAEDPEFKEKLMEKFIEESGSEQNLKKIAEGVDKFTENLSNVNAAFDDIRVMLHKVDLKGLKDRQGIVWKGEKKWEELREKWRALLSESQGTALQSVARCEEFKLFCDGVQQITSLEDPRYKDTITELEEFTKAKGPNGKVYNPKDVEDEAKRHSEAFLKLKDSLSDFKTEFEDFAEYQKTVLDADIVELNRKIVDLDMKIAFDSLMVVSLGTSLGITVFSTLAGGVILAGMGPLSILAIILLVIGALLGLAEAGAFIYFYDKWLKDTAERDALKNEVERKEALKHELEAVVSKLNNQEHGLGYIITQVDLLKNVWLTISNEAFLIVNMLKKAKDMKTLTYYKDQIKTVNRTYNEFGNSLAKFANAA